MTGHVFISYRHSGPDAAYVDSLAEFLTSHGIPVWFDRHIITGDRWHTVIKDRIDTCAALVVVMTPDADTSNWVNREIAQAEAQGKPIFPLLLEGERFFRLADLQYQDVRGVRLPDDRFLEQLRAHLAPEGRAISDLKPRNTLVSVDVEPDAATAPAIGEGDGQLATRRRLWRLVDVINVNALRVAAGVFANVSVVAYFIGSHVIVTVPSREDPVGGVLSVITIVVGVGVLVTRREEWITLLLGLSAWEWPLLSFRIHESYLAEMLQPAWGYWLVGNLTTLAAFGCAAVALWRTRRASQDRRWQRWVAATAVAPLTIATSVIAVNLFGHVFATDSDSSTTFRTMTAAICAATLPLVIFAATGIWPKVVCAIGWLVAGWGIIQIHAWYLSEEYESRLTLLWSLLVVSTIAALVASILPRRSSTT